ncbi:MAG: hypothetical protein ACI82Q_001434, partial [Nonlabens sp.]
CKHRFRDAAEFPWPPLVQNLDIAFPLQSHL